MAQIGLKYPVFAPLTESGGSATYTNGVVLSKAISADVSITTANGKLYGDDDVAERDNRFVSGTITIGVTHLSSAVRALLLGHTLNEVTIGASDDIEEVVSKESDEGPYGGLGFYVPIQVNGVRKYRAIWFSKVKFSEPNEQMETKGETVNFQTPSLTGSIDRDVNGIWKREIVVSTETDAVAWLNEKADIGVPADKTDLTTAITAAELLDPEDYTSASWVAFANALAAAKVVAAMTGATQARVDEALAILEGAQDNLVTRA